MGLVQTRTAAAVKKHALTGNPADATPWIIAPD
jgi:hypothetical protein